MQSAVIWILTWMRRLGLGIGWTEVWCRWHCINADRL